MCGLGPNTILLTTHRQLHNLACRLGSVAPCVKGPFHDAMRSKLRQASSPRSNEVVAIDYALLIHTLNQLPPTNS